MGSHAELSHLLANFRWVRRPDLPPTAKELETQPRTERTEVVRDQGRLYSQPLPNTHQAPLDMLREACDLGE